MFRVPQEEYGWALSGELREGGCVQIKMFILLN